MEMLLCSVSSGLAEAVAGRERALCEGGEGEKPQDSVSLPSAQGGHESELPETLCGLKLEGLLAQI